MAEFFNDGGGTGGSGSMGIGNPVTSGTQGSVLFVGAAGVLAQDNANFNWDDANDFLWVLNGIKKPGASIPVAAWGLGSNFVFSVWGEETSGGGTICAVKHANVAADPLQSAEFTAYVSRGTLAVPTSVVAGDRIVRHGAVAKVSTASFQEAARIDIDADINFDAVSGPNRASPGVIRLYTTQQAGTSPTEAWRIDSSLNLYPAFDSSIDLGVLLRLDGVTLGRVKNGYFSSSVQIGRTTASSRMLAVRGSAATYIEIGSTASNTLDRGLEFKNAADAAAAYINVVPNTVGTSTIMNFFVGGGAGGDLKLSIDDNGLSSFTGQCNVSVGNAGAPGWAFAGHLDAGSYWVSDGVYTSFSGTPQIRIGSNAVQIATGGAFQWGTGDPGSSVDTLVTRSAAGFIMAGTATKGAVIGADANNVFVKPSGGQLAFAAGANATSATTGYFCIPSSAGAPTGVPANIPTGSIPFQYDSTNNKLYAYNGGWKKAQVSAVDVIFG